ncbi:hypothetical protein LCGC14_1227800 [marine sediment metagenome]|uniref:Uncharacterized protein n=1 Tax=marine sediment metagenome TaxID=412755 RepID=A0A0F9L9D8_9ZZZZ
MFIEVKREISVVSHYNEMESELLYTALTAYAEDVRPGEAKDCVLNMLAEMQTIEDKVQVLLNVEQGHSKARKA